MDSEINLLGLPPPLSATEFLEHMETDLPGLYLLGSLNRHITVHSQQRRAVNLIQALMQKSDSRRLEKKSIAIIGAGFAGLTAAAFALEETNAKVTLFDAAPRPLWLQDGCGNRWLHPGIYDWPLPSSLEPCTSLPVLNWRAGAARDVTSQIRAEWERIASTKGLLHLRLETEVTAVTGPIDDRLLVSVQGGDPASFDIVILAVGFGLERGGHGRIAYWNDADGLNGVAEGSSVLVVGFGDGGLADVLRLCLPDIRQDSLIELVRHVPLENRRQLLEWDKRPEGGALLDQFYGELRLDPIVQNFMDAASPVAQVTLAGKGYLYGPRSAILNRFLISQLRQARGERAFELVKGPVDSDSLTQLPDGRCRIKLGPDGEDREFDHVVFRFGPEAVYPRISPLSDWKVGKIRRQHWYEMPQSLDPTRVPLREESRSHVSEEDWRQDFLAYESSSRRWCLVLYPPEATVEWAVHARLALEEVQDMGRLNVEPLMLCSEEAISTPSAIRGTVRALCAADIVIADVTGYDPSLLLLLGIRAAVRRSVTIACTEKSLTAQVWQDLPFNLKELNLVSFSDQDKGHKELQQALRAGLAQSSVSARYLDLPVYDYVREEAADDVTMSNSQRVLLLRAFTSYGDARKIHVQKRIREGLGFSKEALVESVIDQTSPRLAGQRLYEAIRHWTVCVADLTWWRPNVMFELGVRLAVRPSGTYCLIDTAVEGADTFRGVRANLIAFLHPFSYNLSTANFSKAFTSQIPDPNPIYEMAVRHFRTMQDRHDEQVDAMLVAAAAVTKSQDDPLQAVDFTPLYARDNRTYGNEIRHSAFERLCAAWCYLADREEPHAVRPIDLLDWQRAEAFRRFRRLGSRLKVGLAQRFGQQDERLGQRIASTENVARQSGALAMVGLLDAWIDLQRDPPWKIDVAKTKEEDWPYIIEDYEDQLQQLAALEARLEELASPVCELPLQGVRSDRRRAEIVLQQFRRRIS